MVEVKLTASLRDYLELLADPDPDTSWHVPQWACDRLEALGLYADRGGVTEAGRAALSSKKGE